MRPDPRFSVLVPSFNAMPYISATLDSVLAQLGDHDELVLQDGGSTDGTTEVLAAAADRDARVSLLSERDGGQSDALNRALARASNDFVVWLNADDLLVDGALEAMREALIAAPAARLAWGGHRYIRADGATIEDFQPTRFSHDLFMRRGCYVFSGSVAYAAETLRALGGFRTDLHYCMDLDLMLALEETVPAAEIVAVPRIVGALRWHDASKSGSVAMPFLREGWQVRGGHLRGVADRARRLEAFLVLGVAHATVGLRHTGAYRRLRRVALSPFSSVKTSAPVPNAPR